MKMIFHFPRVLESDIKVDGVEAGDCLNKALSERQKQCTPMTVKGEIVEEGQMVFGGKKE